MPVVKHEVQIPLDLQSAKRQIQFAGQRRPTIPQALQGVYEVMDGKWIKIKHLKAGDKVLQYNFCILFVYSWEP